LPTSEPADVRPSWKIRNHEALIRWAFDADTSVEDGVGVLEFVRDVIARDPDFGEVIDEHTRGDVVPNCGVEVIWTFNPERRYVEIITPIASG
jgi:hypothetical protein